MASENSGLIVGNTDDWVPAHWQDVLEETTDWLQNLVRFDTSNPPGNERPAAQFLHDILVSEGIESEIAGPHPNRSSVLARVPGDGSGGRPLLLVSHLDVVPATPAGWDVEPFSATLKDGFVWGRGAMDCKHRVATQAMMLVLAKRRQLNLKRDLVLAACADEETGGQNGMGWLAENRRRKVDAEYVLGEGGGGEVPAPQGNYCAVATAEKGAFELTITLRGQGGHSLRIIPNGAMSRLGQLLARLEEMRLSSAMTDTAASSIETIAPGQSAPVQEALYALLSDATRDEGMAGLRRTAPGLAGWLQPSLYNSIVPTMVQGGESAHAYPTEVKLHCNVRFLPGESIDNVLDLIRARLDGIDDVELGEVEESFFAWESPSDTALFRIIRNLYEDLSPGTVVVPMLLGGSTDVRFLRAPDRAVYGFFPSISNTPAGRNSGGHCTNERVALYSINRALHILYELITRLCL